MTGSSICTRITAQVIVLTGLLMAATAADGQVKTAATTCPADQRLEAKLGFESFDCDGCKLRRDPETGMAYLEFTKPPVVRGVGTTGSLRDGDQLTHVDGTSILSSLGAKKLATLQRGVEARFTIRRNNAALQVALTPEYVCKAQPSEFGPTVGMPSLTGNFKGDSLRYSYTPSQFTFEQKGDSVLSRWIANAPVLNSFQAFKWNDSLALRGYVTGFKGFTADSIVWPATNSVYSGQAWTPSFYNFSFGDAQPQGWFGFALGCDSCTYRSSEAPYYTTRNRGLVSQWRFSAAPRIVSVDTASPAERAGLRVGDLLTAIDGIPIASTAGGERFSAVQPGDTVQVRYTRGTTNSVVRLLAAQRPTFKSYSVRAADLVLRMPGQSGENTIEIRGDSITVTEDPKTGERTITGTNMTIVMRPPR